MRSLFLNTTAAILVAAIVAGGLCGCAGGKQAAPTPQAPAPVQPAQPAQPARAETPVFPVTLIDGMEREVRITSKPNRVVSMVPAATETLFALGAGDRVVGVTKFCDYPAEAKEKEQIGDYTNPSVEKIVSLRPDLVVGDFIHPELATRLNSMGIPVFLLNSQTVAEAVRTIRLIGKAIGEEKAANALAAQMESRVDAIRARVETIPEASRPKVFHEMWDEPLMASGPGTIMDDLIRLAGGVNVAADAKTLYPKYSLESLVAKNPDVIVYTFHNDIAQNPGKGWAGIAAVKEGRVYQLTDDLVSRPGPRIVDGLEELARRIHPGLFR